jgi:aryl-alcohol dehydrogenase-like predicted oxidoreductase
VRQRRLGRTGLFVSEIGFGGGGIGGVYGQTTAAEAVRAVRRSLELGVNFFDVAPAYGDGLAERVLGEGLAGQRDEVIVATKVALEEESFGDVRGFVRGSVEGSLRRLGTDYLDLLLVHNPLSSTRGRPVQVPGDIYMVTAADALMLGEELRLLQQQGIVRHLGFTGWRCTRAALLELLDSGLFDVVQVEYNLLNHSAVEPPAAGQDVTPLEKLEADPGTEMAGWAYQPIDQHLAVRLAAERDVGVVCIRPLAGGLLSEQLDRTDEPGTQMNLLRRRVAALAFLTEQSERTLSQAALAFSLANDSIATVIPGVKNAAEIEDAVLAAENGPLDAQTVDRVTALARSNDAT